MVTMMVDQKKGDKLMTAEEAAQVLGLKGGTIYKHIEERRIPSVRLYTGQPRLEPLVVQCLREGGSEAAAKEVATALAQGMPVDEIVKIWREPRSGKLIAMPMKKRGGKHTKKPTDDGPPPGAA